VPEGEGLTLSEMREMEHLKAEGNLAENVKEERVRDGVVEKGRFVDVGVFPMGIDVKQLQIRKWVPFFFFLSSILKAD